MPRPCPHAGKEHNLACRVCQWALSPTLKGRQYREKWKEPEPPSTVIGAAVATGTPANGAVSSDRVALAYYRRLALPCRHLGEPIGELVPCDACGQHHQTVAVHACARHAECTHEKSGSRIVGVVRRKLAWCQGCSDHEPAPAGSAVVPDLLPDLPDPLPEAELSVRPPGWACLPAVRERHIEALGRLLKADVPPPALVLGDGIVTCGGGNLWPMLVVQIHMTRDVCDLPIQVWHRGWEEPVDPADVADVPGVTFHDLTTVPTRICRGWESKSIALVNCGLRRVLFLDADAYLVGNPLPLFERASEHGMVYWEDLPDCWHKINWHWYGAAVAASGNNGQWAPPVQGGQFVIDRVKWWRELVIFHWLNQHSDYTYHCPKDKPQEQHGYGDQCQHRVVMSATGNRGLNLGQAPWVPPAFVCSLSGKPIVTHRCQGKMLSASTDVRTTHLPGDTAAWRHLDRFLLGSVPDDATAVFANVYRRGLWGHGDRSGGGSTQREATPYIDIVNALAAVAGWTCAVDLGSGDGVIASQLQIPEVITVDCYPGHHPMVTADIDRDRESLPEGDVALLKDVVQHWPDSLMEWIEWARKCGKWRWVLITNDHLQQHPDPPLGGYRGLDPAKEPLVSLGLRKVASYLHKTVMLLKCE